MLYRLSLTCIIFFFLICLLLPAKIASLPTTTLSTTELSVRNTTSCSCRYPCRSMPKGEIIGLFVVCGVGIYCASCASLVFLFLRPKIVEDNSDLRNGDQASFYWRKSCLLAYRCTASISISSGSQFESGYLVQTRARQRNLANLTTLQSTRASFVVCKEGHTMKYLALLERRSVHFKSKFPK
ncbi:hypothetical protein V8E51_004322 [Hyaloscypha variabilis]